MVKYCSKEYKFPKKAFVAIIWFTDDTDRLSAALSSQVHKNIDQVRSYIKGLISVLTKKEKVEVIEISVYELEMIKLLENKPEYWTEIPFDQKLDDGTMTDKIGWLTPFIKSPLLYDLLVVPRTEIGGEMIFDVAKTFFKGDSNMNRIEEFMYYSTQIVEPTAKHSGIYKVKDLFVIDWKTNQIKQGHLGKLDDEELMD